MQKMIHIIFRILGAIAPGMGGRLAYYLFFKPFRLKPHPKDLILKDNAVKTTYGIQGNKTYVWKWGEGPVILFAHGWSSKGLHYRGFIAPLVNAGYSVVIPDFPGHVQSEGKSSNVLQFRDTIHAISQNQGPIYGLVGHSLGAMACILSMVDYGIKPEKFVMFNSAIYADTIMNRFMEQVGGNTRIENSLRTLLKKQFNQDFSYYSTAVRVKEINELPESMVIVDDNDVEVPMEEGKEMQKLLNAELIITNDLGHNEALKNKEVIGSVVNFLTKKNRD